MSGRDRALSRRLWLGGAIASLVVSQAPVAAAGDEELDRLLKTIAEGRKKLKTLQADFAQTRTIGLLATKVKSKGRLTLVMPNRLRWDLLPPDDVTYWLGPKGLAMRNSEGVKKIGKSAAGRFAAVLDDLRVMIGGDLRALRKRYALSVKTEDGETTITARPKGETIKKEITRLEVVVDTKEALLERVTIVEKNGDQSAIAFYGFVKNKPVPDAIIEPPSE